MPQQPVYATTSNPDLQCFSNDCLNVGTSYCMWPQACCRGTLRAGCKRRFCQLHKYEKQQMIRGKHGTRYNILMCCMDCGSAMEADIVSNQKYACAGFCAFIICLMLVMFLPMIIILNNTPDCRGRYCD